MWWKNVKLNVMIGFVVIFLVWLLVGLGCGLPGILHFKSNEADFHSGWGKCV